MKTGSALIYDLSRTLDLVLLPHGSAMLLRNDRPAFQLSDSEMKNLARVWSEQVGVQVVVPGTRPIPVPAELRPPGR